MVCVQAPCCTPFATATGSIGPDGVHAQEHYTQTYHTTPVFGPCYLISWVGHMSGHGPVLGCVCTDMKVQRYSFFALILCISTTSMHASSGDRDTSYRDCVQRCAGTTGCADVVRGSSARAHGLCPLSLCQQRGPLALQIFRWDCLVRHGLVLLPSTVSPTGQS